MWAILLPFLATSALSQSPPSPPTTCAPGYSLGRDEVIYTYAYTFPRVLPIISSFKNLTWSFVDERKVSLNATNNERYTSREYKINGFKINETLQYYNIAEPQRGPFQQVHSAAELKIPQLGFDVYIPYDDMVLKEECGGRAASLNLTAVFCATDVEKAGDFLHMTHSQDEREVERLLGGRAFEGCRQLLPSNGTEVPRMRDVVARGSVYDSEISQNSAGESRWVGLGVAAAVGPTLLSCALGVL